MRLCLQTGFLLKKPYLNYFQVILQSFRFLNKWNYLDKSFSHEK